MPCNLRLLKLQKKSSAEGIKKEETDAYREEEEEGKKGREVAEKQDNEGGRWESTRNCLCIIFIVFHHITQKFILLIIIIKKKNFSRSREGIFFLLGFHVHPMILTKHTCEYNSLFKQSKRIKSQRLKIKSERKKTFLLSLFFYRGTENPSTLYSLLNGSEKPKINKK